jgi:hypothetical protein
MASDAEIRGYMIRAFVASFFFPGCGLLYALVQTRTQLRDEPRPVKARVFAAGTIWLALQVFLLASVVTT